MPILCAIKEYIIIKNIIKDIYSYEFHLLTFQCIEEVYDGYPLHIFSCEATLQIIHVRPSVRPSPKSDLSEFVFFNQVNTPANK